MSIYSSTIKDVQQAIFDTADEKCWHESERSIPELLCLVHAEVSEALEEYRNGRTGSEIYYSYTLPNGNHVTSHQPDLDGNPGKPEGIAAELADTIIRVLDMCAEKGIPVLDAMEQKMEYNGTRSYRHGGKVV